MNMNTFIWQNYYSIFFCCCQRYIEDYDFSHTILPNRTIEYGNRRSMCMQTRANNAKIIKLDSKAKIQNFIHTKKSNKCFLRSKIVVSKFSSLLSHFLNQFQSNGIICFAICKNKTSNCLRKNVNEEISSPTIHKLVTLVNIFDWITGCWVNDSRVYWTHT